MPAPLHRRRRARAVYRGHFGARTRRLLGACAGLIGIGACTPEPSVPIVEGIELMASGQVDVRLSEPMAVHENFKPFSWRLSVAYELGDGQTAFVDLGLIDELGFDPSGPCSGDVDQPITRHAPFSVASIEQPAPDVLSLIPSYAPAEVDLAVCEQMATFVQEGGRAGFVLHYREFTGAAALRSRAGAPLAELARFWPGSGNNCDVQDLGLDEIETNLQTQQCPFP